MGDPIPKPNRVLFVVSEFAPMVSVGRLRVQSFARYLPTCGWEPTVLTFDPRDIWRTDESLLDEIPAGLSVQRVRWVHPYDLPFRAAGWIRRRQRGEKACRPRDTDKTLSIAGQQPGRLADLTRLLVSLKERAERHTLIPDESITGVVSLIRRGVRLHRQRPFDAIVVSVPAYATWLAGLGIKRACGMPLIVDYRDLWDGDVLRQWIPGWRRRFERALERRALARTDAVVTVSSRYTQRVRELDPDPRSRMYETIYSGFDPRCVPNSDEPSGRKDADEPIHLLYVGRLFKNRRADGLVRALGRLASPGALPTGRWRLTFLGDVAPDQRQRLDALIREFGIDERVHFERFVPRPEALERQRRADALVLIVDEGQASDGTVPGKLFEYLALGRRIVAICPAGETDHLLRQSGFSLIARPNQPDQIESVLRKLFAQIEAGADVGVPASENRLPFVAQRQAQVLANVLNSVTRPSGRPVASGRRRAEPALS